MHNIDNTNEDKSNLIGKTFGNLTILSIDKEDFLQYKCSCGQRGVIHISQLDKRRNLSCGKHNVTERKLTALNRLWNNFTIEEKSNWGTWQDFVLWSEKEKGYCNIYSSRKLNRKLPYNKDNLEYGLFINKEFFSIKRLKDNRIVYDEEDCQFVTSKRIKNLIINDTRITRSLTRQSSKHKMLPIELFKLLK
jgi:hypothetical protein